MHAFMINSFWSMCFYKCISNAEKMQHVNPALQQSSGVVLSVKQELAQWEGLLCAIVLLELPLAVLSPEWILFNLLWNNIS